MPEAPSQNRAPASPTQVAPSEKQLGRFSRDRRDGAASTLENPFAGGTPYGSPENLRYPINLNENQTEYTHWIAFYPLVREDTQMARDLGDRATVFEQNGQQRVNAEHATLAGGIQGAVIGGGTLGAKALTDLGKDMSSAGGLAKFFASGGAAKAAGAAAFKTAAGALVGGAAGAALNGIGARRVLMGSRAVVLGIQDKLSYGYSANYDVSDLGGLVGAAASGNFSGEASLKDIGYDVGALAARKTAKLAGAIGGNSVTNLKEATSKAVENPYKEQLFKNMGFRKFGFEYKFAPRSLAEGEKIFGKNGIIETFIKHMHPEPSNAGVFLIYPSEFLIVIYHSSGRENKYVRKISNCALTNMTIDYGAEGFTTFQGTKGMPTEATVRLEFTELETLTNKRIAAGY